MDRGGESPGGRVFDRSHLVVVVRPQDGIDWEIGRVASRSHGVITRAELARIGVTTGEIKHRIAAGVLLRVHRGVYRVGHRAPSVEARYLAAVWACGAGAVLRGLAAGHVFGVVKGAAPPPEVVAPIQRRIAGVRTRRYRSLDRRDRTTWRGIPVTTVPRTLVDLAEVLSFDALSRACHEAGVLHRTTPAQVGAALQRRPNAPGARNVRRVIAGWSEHALTVELDSYRYHNSRYAWEQDRRREREAHARGDQHRRYTYNDVFDEPGPMLVELGAVLVP